MQPLPPPPDVKTALDEFHFWGAVVEPALFAAPSTVDISTHQLAAQSGLHAAIEELNNALKRLIKPRKQLILTEFNCH